MSKYTTKQRQTLLDYLQRHADDTLSAKQIADALASEGVSLSAVYRNLATLEEEGKVRRLTKGGSRQAYYRYTDASDCRGHLHLSCSQCGKTYHMDVPATDTLIRRVEHDVDFQIDRSSTVLVGVCKNCQHKDCQKKD